MLNKTIQQITTALASMRNIASDVHMTNNNGQYTFYFDTAYGSNQLKLTNFREVNEKSLIMNYEISTWKGYTFNTILSTSGKYYDGDGFCMAVHIANEIENHYVREKIAKAFNKIEGCQAVAEYEDIVLSIDGTKDICFHIYRYIREGYNQACTAFGFYTDIFLGDIAPGSICWCDLYKDTWLSECVKATVTDIRNWLAETGGKIECDNKSTASEKPAIHIPCHYEVAVKFPRMRRI